MDSKSKNDYWDLKPYWCQPWSIISFGILVLLFSWILFENVIISLILFFFIVLWWVLFLIMAPKLFQEISEEK